MPVLTFLLSTELVTNRTSLVQCMTYRKVEVASKEINGYMSVVSRNVDLPETKRETY